MRFLLLALLTWTVPTFGAEAFWPGWLGPNRDGWVGTFKAPKTWPAKLQTAWRIKVGEGYGTPLVIGDRVFQHARLGEKEVVWALDLKTGRKVWQTYFETPFKIGGGGEKHGKGPKANPAYANGRLFVMSIAGRLSALDAAEGKVLWRADYDSKFQPSHPRWGMCNSPVVDANRVIAHFGNDESGLLAAFDVRSGKEIWTQGNDLPSYSSPTVVTHKGIRQVIEWNRRALVGVNVKTGNLLWEYPFPRVGTNQNMPTPAFYQGKVLLGGENRGLHGIEPKLENGKWTVSSYWSNRKVSLDMATAIVNDGRLYGLSHLSRGRIFCADSHTGEILWQSPERTADNATFLAFSGYIMVLLNKGELRVVKADAERYEQVAAWQVADTPTWAAPVLLQQGVLIKDRDHLTFWTF